MKISIFLPILLFLGLLITGCAEITTSVDKQSKTNKDLSVIKNNQTYKDEIITIKTEEKNKIRFDSNDNEYKIRKITNLAQMDNNEYYQVNKPQEVYLNVQYQF